jgi:hypothetical protein
MRQLKPTPLFIISIGLVLYGLYVLIFVDPGEEGWGTLFAIVIGGAGVVGLMVYAILRATLKKKLWTQVGIETILIAGLFYIGYRKSGIYEFHLPHNYRGYVIVVYGVDNAPKLKTPFYSNKIEFNITSSGIIVTSSLPNDNYSDPAVFLDSTLGEIHKLPKPYTRHDIPYSTDTLECDGKNYLVDIWLIKDEPNWIKSEDTLNRLDLKLIEACTMTKQ